VIGSTAVTCTCRVTDVLVFWDEPEASGVFDIECYVVTVSNSTNTSMMPTIPSDICNITSTVSSDIDIMTTNSTTLTFPISPGINYSVLVWTVSKCGQLSDPAMVPTDEEFLSIGKWCIESKTLSCGPSPLSLNAWRVHTSSKATIIRCWFHWQPWENPCLVYQIFNLWSVFWKERPWLEEQASIYDLKWQPLMVGQ